jgi:hypothetical protein
VCAKAVLAKEVAKNTWMLDAGMLENEKIHRLSGLWGYCSG